MQYFGIQYFTLLIFHINLCIADDYSHIHFHQELFGSGDFKTNVILGKVSYFSIIKTS